MGMRWGCDGDALWTQAGGASDAERGTSGAPSSARVPHHTARSRRSSGARSGSAHICGERAQSVVDRRHHVRADTARRVPLPGCHPRCVQSARRGVVQGGSSARRARRRSAGDGRREPATRGRAHPPLGSRLPIDRAPFQRALSGRRHRQAAGIRCSMGSMGSVGDSSENKQLTGTVARALILTTYGHEACDGDATCLGGGLRQVHLVA